MFIKKPIYQKRILKKVEPFLHHYITDAISPKSKRKKSSDLMTWNRFDLTFKIFFLEQMHIDFELGEEVYCSHIKAFGMGKYQEPDNPNKNSKDAFIKVFKGILNNFKEKGFDENLSLIPIAIDGSIVNGAHRLAAAIFLKKNVSYINTSAPPHIYDYNFFKERNIPASLLDLMACKFIEYTKNTYLAFIWPSTFGSEVIVERYIDKVVYKKIINLSYNGAHNLLTQIYAKESWIGTFENNYEGVKGKLFECFRINKPLTVIAFQAKNLKDVLAIKRKIRSNFSLGKHSIHISDSPAESLSLSRLIFNENSIHFLNYAKPTKYLSTLKYLDFIKTRKFFSGTVKDSVMFDSGFVLALYGLRETSDLDFISISQKDEIFKSNDLSIHNHNNQLTFHKKSKQQLFANPENYFYYDNIKFVSFNQVYKMKKNRSELKDKIDCHLMNSITEKNIIKPFIFRLIQCFFYVRLKFYYFFYYLLKKFSLLEFAKLLLRKR